MNNDLLLNPVERILTFLAIIESTPEDNKSEYQKRIARKKSTNKKTLRR